MVPELWWAEHECVKDRPKFQDIVEDAGRLCDVRVGDCRFAVDALQGQVSLGGVYFMYLMYEYAVGHVICLSFCQSISHSVALSQACPSSLVR
jgi:hypothetical protein